MVTMRHREILPRQDADEPRPKMWPQVKEGLPGSSATLAPRGCRLHRHVELLQQPVFAIFVLYMVRVAGPRRRSRSASSSPSAPRLDRRRAAREPAAKRLGVGPRSSAVAVVFSFAGTRLPARPEVVPAAGAHGRARGCSGSARSRTTSSGQLPPGDHARAAAGPDERRDALDRLGDDPARDARRRRDRQARRCTRRSGSARSAASPTFLWVLFSPLRSIREMPEPVDEPTPAEAELEGGVVEPVRSPAPPPPMRQPSGALWSHRDFLKLWTGQTISEFGSQISQLAIPTVAVLTLKATPFQVAGSRRRVPALPALHAARGCLGRPLAASLDPDRGRPRCVQLLLASIPSLPARAPDARQLYVVGFLVGISTVFFDVAYQSYLPPSSTARRSSRGTRSSR